jgi:glutathione S-transferase
MLKLAYSPRAVALACHIALEEAGATYELVRVDFSKNEQRQPAYLAVNPKGRVPALITPRGVLTETAAILVFIAQSYPAARLAPLDEPFAFARMQAFNVYLAATVHVAYAHARRGTRWADDPVALADMARKTPQTVLDACLLIETGMLEGPWVMGDAYTVADAYLFTIANWLESASVDVARLPRLMDHRARVRARPAVQRVMPFHE